MEEPTNRVAKRYWKRNQKILELADKGWRYVAIAKMFKMKVSTVSMVVWRARHKRVSIKGQRVITGENILDTFELSKHIPPDTIITSATLHTYLK